MSESRSELLDSLRLELNKLRISANVSGNEELEDVVDRFIDWSCRVATRVIKPTSEEIDYKFYYTDVYLTRVNNFDRSLLQSVGNLLKNSLTTESDE